MSAPSGEDAHERRTATVSRRAQPAPYLVIHDFLPLNARNAMFDYLVGKADQFEPAQIGPGLYRDVRRSRFLGNCLDDLEARWRAIFTISLEAAFRAALPRIGVAEFSPRGMEYHALLYRDGDFFRPHRDDEPGGSRAVTYVYHVHRQPKSFSGGELVLYDSYDDSSSEERTPTSVRLEPEDNRLILFPAHCLHEVLEVRGPEHAADARIAINGWFHRH